MWTADNRPRYNRDKLRYPSDLTDAEWAHIEPLIPPGKPGGGKRRVAIREVINREHRLPKDLLQELGRHAPFVDSQSVKPPCICRQACSRKRHRRCCGPFRSEIVLAADLCQPGT